MSNMSLYISYEGLKMIRIIGLNCINNYDKALGETSTKYLLVRSQPLVKKWIANKY